MGIPVRRHLLGYVRSSRGRNVEVIMGHTILQYNAFGLPPYESYICHAQLRQRARHGISPAISKYILPRFLHRST